MAEAPEKLSEPTGIQATPPEGRATEPEAYRPLSLLAMAGFGLSVVYAVCVLAGGLVGFAGANLPVFIVLLVLALLGGALGPVVSRDPRPGKLLGAAGIGLASMLVLIGLGSLMAYSGSTPWKLSGWFWLLAIAAVLVSWLARWRIAASEGTLEGGWLARWGLYIGLFFGTFYGLYEAANVVAVRPQAQAHARAFLADIEKGDLHQAFLKSLPQGSWAGGDPEEFIEAAHNTAQSMQATGTYTMFRLAEFVRLLQNANGQAKIEYIGAPYQFKQNAYEVEVQYTVTTPQGSFDLVVTVKGQTRGAGARSWHVMLERTGRDRRKEVVPTTDGARMKALDSIASDHARGWLQSLSRGQVDSAYLLTLSEAERARGLEALVFGMPAAGGLAGIAALPTGGTFAGDNRWVDQRPEFRHKRDQFAREGYFDAKGFWAVDKLKADILDKMKKAVTWESGGGIVFELLPPVMPLVREEESRRTLSYGVRGTLFVGGKATYLVEGDLVIEAPARGMPLPSQLRVLPLLLRRGQAAPAETGRPGAPGMGL